MSDVHRLFIYLEPKSETILKAVHLKLENNVL